MKDTSGPAFPAIIPLEYSEQQGKDYPNYQEAGITHRQWLAGLAMQAIRTNMKSGELSDTDIATDAYGIADAMLTYEQQEQG